MHLICCRIGFTKYWKFICRWICRAMSIAVSAGFAHTLKGLWRWSWKCFKKNVLIMIFKFTMQSPRVSRRIKKHFIEDQRPVYRFVWSFKMSYDTDTYEYIGSRWLLGSGSDRRPTLGAYGGPHATHWPTFKHRCQEKIPHCGKTQPPALGLGATNNFWENWWNIKGCSLKWLGFPKKIDYL